MPSVQLHKTVAVGYLRRSKKSEANTVSLDDQLRHVQAYADSHAMALAGIMTHDGVSGGKRARFGELKEQLLAVQAKAVVFYNLDRLARDAAGLDNFLTWCATEAIEIHETTSGKIDTKRAISKFVNRVRGAVDELYKDLIGEKTADALAYLKKEGRRYSNHAPMGWQYVDGRLVENAEEQRALVIIERCRLEGLGRYTTRRLLRASGYTGRGGLSTIQKLLEVRE